MSEIRLSSEKRLRLFAGRGFPELADEVAAELGIPLTPMSAYDFANGEICSLRRIGSRLRCICYSKSHRSS